MADTKISDLAAVTDVLDTDEFVLARSGATKKIDGGDLKAAGGLLALQVYAPSSQTVLSTTSATFADVDATNAAVTFTAPASGNVIVRISCWVDTGASGDGFMGLRESTTDISGTVTRAQRAESTAQQYLSVPMYVSGISAGSHTYKVSFAVAAGDTFRIIVQDGTVATTKWGPLIIEVWAAP